MKKLAQEAKNIVADSKKPRFKWTNKMLTVVCRYKRVPGDLKMPTRHDELLKRWNKTKGRSSPNVSSVEDESESESDEGESESDESISECESDGDKGDKESDGDDSEEEGEEDVTS